MELATTYYYYIVLARERQYILDKKSKLSEAQKRANKKWDQKNKERKAYISKRSTARNFIKKIMDDQDLEEFKILIEERIKYGKLDDK